MKIELTSQFLDLVPVLEKLQSLGYQAYFVGGAVRDLLIDKPIHDIDITTNATPTQIKKAFKHIENYSGEKHGTVLAFLDDKSEPIEITTFRIDGDYLDGRHPENVSFTNDLKEDLARRDFTINSLALNKEGEVIDFFDGLSDLDRKTIKAVGNPDKRFEEDGLRMIRAIRFAAQLDFVIEKSTLESIKKNKELLTNISIERNRDEIEKLMLADNANSGLQLIEDTKIHQYLPSSDGHYRYENQLKLNPINKIQAWFIFRSFWNIENLEKKSSFLKNDWKIDNDTSRAIRNIDENIPLNSDSDDELKIKIFNLAGYFDDLIAVGLSLTFINVEQATQYKKIKDDLKINSAKELKITGTDLVKQKIATAGPKLGKILKQLLEEVVLNKIENNSTSLLQRAKDLTDD